MPRRRPYQSAELPEHVVRTDGELGDCLDHLRTHPRIGFDTEFIGEETYRPDLCLLQVATPERLYLIDPLTCGPLDGFWELLHDPDRQTLVHAGREEIRMCWFGTGSPPVNVVDLQIAAALVGLQYSIGYGALVAEILGVRMAKGETLTDWRRRPLTPAQMQYAYDDVRYLLPMWDRLADRLDTLDRVGWATEEFATAVRRAVVGDPTVEKWRKLRGIGNLRPRELAAVRAVFAWRETIALRQNRPVRTVLRDDLIVEIARRSSGTNVDLSTLRGLPKNESATITARVAEALAAPAETWPTAADRDNDPPHVGLLASLLGVILNDFAARSDLAPGLVATVSDLKALARARQPGGRPPPDSPLFTGWRAECVLPYLEAVLDGQLCVTVADPTAAAPLAVRAVDG